MGWHNRFWTFFPKNARPANHFIIVDGRDEPFRPNLDEIVQICNAQVGIGGEQLLIIEPPGKRGLDKNTTPQSLRLPVYRTFYLSHLKLPISEDIE